MKTSRNPLDMLFDFAEIGAKKAQRVAKQKSQLARLRIELTKLDGYCLPNDFRLPTYEQLEGIGDLVTDLANYLYAQRVVASGSQGGHRRFSFWGQYTAVDRRWRGLHLCKRLERLVIRARKHTPERPFESFDAIASGSDGDALLAREFLETLPTIVKAPATALVDWERYSPLLLRVRNEERQRAGKKPLSLLVPRLRSATGSPALVAYTVFLEIAHEDARWMRKYWQGIQDLLSSVRTINPEFVRELRRFYITDKPNLETKRAEAASERKRKAARERQRRFRARKGLSPKA